MNTLNPRHVTLVVAVAAWVVIAALPFNTARAQQKTYEMKISAPTIHDVPDTYGANLLAALEKDTGGRITGKVYPASQLGSIPRQIEGTQFGSIQCTIVPPEFYVGVDPRFEVMAAPGLVGSLAEGQKVAADPEVLKLMLSLGAEKGLHGEALFMAEPSDIVSRVPIRTLADFKGKKLRIFASQFQSEAFKRLGVTPVAMSLGDVLPAIQQGTIDGAVTGLGPINHFHFIDAAKYVTMTDQPGIFLIVEFNRKWYESLPKDLQQILDKDALEQAVAIRTLAAELHKKSEAEYAAAGGEEIKLTPDEQATLMKTLSSVGADVSKSSPQLAAAYKVVTDAAARARQSAAQ